MANHKDYGKLRDGKIVEAPSALTVTVIDEAGNRHSVYRGEVALTAEDYLSQGWKKVVDDPPKPSDEKHYVYPTGWEEYDATIVRTYAEAEVPPAPSRQFSKLKIYGAIAQLGAWDKVKEWLEQKDVGGMNGWTAFTLAQEVSESHEMFATLAEEARKLLGMTQEQFDAMLDECVLEG